MLSFFIIQQYPAAIVDRTVQKAFSIDRATALIPKARPDNDRILFTMTFHPMNNSIKPIFNRNFNLLNLIYLILSVNTRFYLLRKTIIFTPSWLN